MKLFTPVSIFLALITFGFVLSTCQKEYSLETNVSLAAAGTLRDTTTGMCIPDTVIGTYYDGVTPGRDTDYVIVHVNVTNAGTFNITTDTQNGFYFSDSGYFSATGPATIKLYPVGTPIIPQAATNFNLTFDTSICSFSVTVKDSTGTGLGGNNGGSTGNAIDSAWYFTGPFASYNGPMDTAFTKDTAGVLVLYIQGSTQATGDTVMQLGIEFSNNTVTSGTYSTQSSAFFQFANAISGNVIYTANPATTNSILTVTITSYNSSTHIITGSYTGTAQNAAGSAVNILNGYFTATVSG